MLQFDPITGQVIVPKTKEEKINEAEEGIKAIWKKISFNCGRFFNEMSFIGGITGRRNRYYLYKKDNILMLSTGFSEEKPTRINFFFSEEVNFLKDFIIDKYLKDNLMGAPIYLIMDQLRDNLDSIPDSLPRLKIIIKLYKDNLDVINLFYSFILSSFYILAISDNQFSIDRDRKKYVLLVGQHIKESLVDIYKSSEICGFDKRRIIFRRNKFYFVISVNMSFRGICYIYDEREIEHVKSLIKRDDLINEDIWRDKREINCYKVLLSINQNQNDICLVCYREIIAKNIRNGRSGGEYTESRLKLALKIIKIINGGIVIDKDGRKNRYFISK